MPAVFISHASEDKLARVKPLVEALAHQLTLKNLELWIDRPGHGESHFGFDDDFIKKYRIRDLRSGMDWAEQIDAALEEAGAVLWCLSKVGLAKALGAPQEVLAQEVLFGWRHKKLVVCIVDDLRLSEMPPRLGSVELSKIQMERIDPSVLERALACLREATTVDAEKFLPSDAKRQWEIVRKLTRDINSAIGTRTITDEWSLKEVFAPFLAERRTYFFGRRWLFDRIGAWPDACRSERMMLVSGTPGTGKSAIMAHFVDQQPCGPVLAYHCFRYGESRTQGMDRFVRNVAFMLATRLPAYSETLADRGPQQAFKELERSPEDGAVRFFKQGIFEPLAALDKPPEFGDATAWIAVDALDEVTGSDDRLAKAHLVDLFADGLRYLPPWLRIFATSRDDDVAERLGKLVVDGRRLVHRLPIDGADADDQSYGDYVDARLAASDRVLPTRSKAILLARSERNFLYLKLVLDGFLAHNYRVEDINELPPGLPGFYDHDFRRQYPRPRSGDFPDIARPLLEVLAVARNPLSLESLSVLTKVGAVELRRELIKLAAYLPPQAGKYAIFHQSFKDWLLDPEGNPDYALSATAGHARLAEHSWNCFAKRRSRINPGSGISRFADDEWFYAMHYGIDHMLAADWVARPLDLIDFLLESWDDDKDAASAFKDLNPRRFTRSVLHAFDGDLAEDETKKIDPSKLASRLTDFYQIEPLEGPLSFLIAEHATRWASMQDDFLRADNYVLRYAISHVLARECTNRGAAIGTDQIYGYLRQPDINYRELAAYTLRHLYSRDPRLIKVEHLELMGDSATYPSRSALGDLLLNLTFQKRFDSRRIKSRLFWEPIWDHNRLDVWDIKAAKLFLAGEPLPADADDGTKAAHAELGRTEKLRQDLLTTAEVRADPAILNVLNSFSRLGSDLDLIKEAEAAFGECERLQEIMRLLFSHPLWDVAETAASVLMSLIEADRTKREIVYALFEEPNWRVRFGAIETAFQLAEIDRMALFGEAVRRFHGDGNSRVRALCAENLISYILERPQVVREGYLADFKPAIERWLRDDDCWVLEHVFRLLRKLSSDGFECGDFFASGMPVLLQGLPNAPWHELPRETFLTHIESCKRLLIEGDA